MSTLAPAPHGHRRQARRARALPWVMLALVVLALGVGLLGLVEAGANRSAQEDPRSTRPQGHAALAALLGHHGVRTVVVDGQHRAPSSLAGRTAVVSRPLHLTAAELDRLVAARPARLVLLAAPGTLPLPVTATGQKPPAAAPAVAAACDERPARRAEAIAAPRTLLRSSAARVRCFPVGDRAAWVGIEMDGVPIDVVAADLLTNERLPTEGNAALGLDLLGEREELVWVVARELPTTAAAGDEREQPLPDWFWLFVSGLPFFLLVLALWRGKRLGPLLSERLPVIVPASETVEGHGRLYARLGARDTAAAALRAASLRRLASLLGASDAPRLAELVAARTGRSAREVLDVLAGPEPADDAALITLKHHLDRLEQEARQP